ncbi:hypothetical protein CW304_15830 [Bacillus sp. UFRGS-B20]|nr:hypothetical protein CW304_15830 [Bacillus sp. UFRGS-B20]
MLRSTGFHLPDASPTSRIQLVYIHHDSATITLPNFFNSIPPQAIINQHLQLHVYCSIQVSTSCYQQHLVLYC